MLAANVCASDFLAANGPAGALPRARGPDAREARALRAFLADLRARARAAATSRTRRTTRSCWRSIQGRPDFALLQTVMLRSLQQARLHARTTSGHFGLAYEAYAHFTSPIRRYPGPRWCIAASRRCSPASATSPPARPGTTSASTARSPSGAPTTRRATSRPGSSASSCRTRWARTFDGTISGVDELRPLRDAGRPQRRRPRARHRAAARLLPVRPDAPLADRRAQRGRVPARRPRARERGAREPRAGTIDFTLADAPSAAHPAVSQPLARGDRPREPRAPRARR